MRKISLLAALLLLLSTGLWACGGDDDASTTDTTPAGDTASDAAGDTTTADVQADVEAPDAVAADIAEDMAVEDVAADTAEDMATEDVAADTAEDAATEDTTPPPTESELLLAYLEGAGGNYVNTLLPKVIEAADVMAEGLENWVVIDVRADDKYGYDAYNVWKKGANGVKDFDEGHIPGAVSVPLPELIAYAKANLTVDHKILVVCHTGQVAGWGAAALDLLGYNAFSLKWGMSAWNKQFDLWSGNTASTYSAQFVKTADPGKNPAGAYPTLATGKTEPKAILEARLIEVLKAPRSIKAVDLLSAPEEYYIVNYWPEAEYLDPGHIPGAHQYSPKASLLTSALLNTLPMDKKIAVYCYTGQTSAQIATFLNVLGYEAYSVLFGANGMIYDQMTKQKWAGPETGPKAFTFEPAAPKVKEFDLLVQYLEGANGNYVNTTLPKVVEAKDVMLEGLENYVVLDTRAEDKYGKDGDGVWQMKPNGKKDFDDGHIAGATFVPLAEVGVYALTNLKKDDKILVACHTGQNAGHAVLALNLLGYNAWSLKWGMSSWNAAFDLWTGFKSSTYAAQFVKTAEPGKNAAGAYPVIATGKTTVEEILAARLADVLAKPRLMSVLDLMTAPEEFYILNYWPEADYLDMGHVPGAHQYTPKTSLLVTALLNTLPTDKKIAVYCYTGQQSSQVAAFLAVLGYDAWSVKFGTNAMIFDTMTKQKWGTPGTYAYEATP
jgi:rhodanese-related sulfurtransferase